MFLPVQGSLVSYEQGCWCEEWLSDSSQI